MKRTTLITGLLLMFFSISGFAQQRSDFKGHVIDSKGDVYLDGIKIGDVTKGGQIKDAKGVKTATINGDGSVTDANGKKIGRVGKDGKTYYDAGDNIVLTVDQKDDKQTCAIKDSKGNVIGNVHDSYKGMACATHCLSNKMDMKDHKKMESKEHKH